jgi:hypothetical protein
MTRAYYPTQGKYGAKYLVNNRTRYEVEEHSIDPEGGDRIPIYAVIRVRTESTGDWTEAAYFHSLISIHLSEPEAHTAADKAMRAHIARLEKRRPIDRNCSTAGGR